MEILKMAWTVLLIQVSCSEQTEIDQWIEVVTQRGTWKFLDLQPQKIIF